MSSTDIETKRLYESLSDQEREMIHLIAQELSNGKIADGLYILETTVKSHVSSILSKLYLSDRTKVAIYAWRESLMKK